MKTTFDLPTELLNDVRRHAIGAGVELDAAAAELIRKGLATMPVSTSNESRPVIKSHPQTGLPYIESSPDAPARRMTITQSVALDDETQTQLDLEQFGVSHRQ